LFKNSGNEASNNLFSIKSSGNEAFNAQKNCSDEAIKRLMLLKN
jgi:hypothetical protein